VPEGALDSLLFVAAHGPSDGLGHADRRGERKHPSANQLETLDLVIHLRRDPLHGATLFAQ
jgi:hypothetical protein